MGYCTTAPTQRCAKWLDRHNTLVEDARNQLREADRRRVVVFVGDSITDGWRDVGRAVWDAEIVPTADVCLNLGMSGDRTQHLLWRLENGIVDLDIGGALHVLLIGTNNTGWETADGSPRNEPQEVLDGILACVAKIRPNPILVLGLLPRGDNATQQQQIATINAGLASRLSPNEYLDMTDSFLLADGTLDKTLFSDGLHPNECGYRVMARCITSKL